MNSSITLPVKTDTTPVDILHSAANLITHKIRPDTSIVVESYLQYGLERRLRRYELVRDVMNSWDRDNLNALVVLPAGITNTTNSKNPDPVPDNDEQLEIDVVPRTYDAPYAFTLQLYCCPRVGKWVKRIVTLLDSGQMYAAKKPGAKPSDKDSVSLCHLSDFDLYTPTEHQLRKVLKPPKKYCYAVKSQQKSNVFPTGENFVHFFCTDDERTARLFKEQVHGWRSWYLVNRKIDTGRPPTRDASGGGGLARKASTSRPRQSMDNSPYAIGSFKPLMDMDIFDKAYDDPTQPTQQQQQQTPNSPSRERKRLSKGSVRGRSASNYSGPNANANANGLVNLDQEPDFDSKGLLGEKYEERKLESLRRTETQRRRKSSEGPFTEGPSLLNSIPSAQEQHSDPLRRSDSRYRPSTARSTAAAEIHRQRSLRRPGSPTSIRTTNRAPSDHHYQQQQPPMPKPLLDFSENGEEPATSWRTQRGGQGVRAPVGVPLVDLATGRPANKYDVPSSPRSSTRARAPSSSASSSHNAAGQHHQHQQQQQQQQQFHHYARSPQGNETLLGALARSQSVASTSSRYHSRYNRYEEEPAVPPLPGMVGGTLVGRIEARQAGTSRGRSGTVR